MKIAVVFDVRAPVSLRSAWDIRRACKPTWRVTHIAFDFGARHERGHRVDDDDVDGAGADQMSHFQRLLAVSGWETSSESMSTPSFFA